MKMTYVATTLGISTPFPSMSTTQILDHGQVAKILNRQEAEIKKLNHMLSCMETDVVVARDRLNLTIVDYLEKLKES